MIFRTISGIALLTLLAGCTPYYHHAYMKDWTVGKACVAGRHSANPSSHHLLMEKGDTINPGRFLFWRSLKIERASGEPIKLKKILPDYKDIYGVWDDANGQRHCMALVYKGQFVRDGETRDVLHVVVKHTANDCDPKEINEVAQNSVCIDQQHEGTWEAW
ncbi:MAG: hypothetical protein AAF513_01320 [Pseudomonadota bacterium]